MSVKHILIRTAAAAAMSGQISTPQLFAQERPGVNVVKTQDARTPGDADSTSALEALLKKPNFRRHSSQAGVRRLPDNGMTAPVSPNRSR